MGMEILTKYRDKVAILKLRGELVGKARQDVNSEIQKLINSDILGLIIDLDGIEILDSVGLGIFVAAFTTLTKKGKKIVFLNVNKQVGYLINVTKLNQIFEQFDDEDDAVKSFEC